MFMRESDSLDAMLRDWKPPEPTADLDQRVISSYRAAIRPSRLGPRVWRQFWTMRVSVPAPALVAASLVILVLFLWLRAPAAPAESPQTSSVVTRLNINGFRPLPNGEARIVPALEVRK